MWDFCTQSTPVARKDHICDDCGGTISKGERYERCDGKWCGEMSSYKSHTDCHKAVSAIQKNYLVYTTDEGIHPDDFEPEDWQWLVDRMPEESLRLRVAFRQTEGTTHDQ